MIVICLGLRSQVIKVIMDEAEMDSYVFCLAKKKALLRLHKEMNDLVGSIN